MTEQRVRVAIVGAGFGGIATAVKLKSAGFDFTVFEQSAGPGGTWWDNTYPGCEVDTPSWAYSFSFMRYDWTGTHAKQPELRQYAADTIDRFGIRDRFRFESRVEQAVWNEAKRLYEVRLANGEEHEFELVVSCLGLLNLPRYPDWPGLDEFEGLKFHTSRWEHEHDLAGKRVAVVGTGSTACQAVPAIAPEVGHLYVFQREPGWVSPKGEYDYTPEQRERFRRNPWLSKWLRYRAFFQSSGFVKAFRVDSRQNRKAREASLRHIEETIPDPELRAAVTPQYAYGCKRVIRASTYYESLNRENVTLVPKEVVRVTPRGLVDADGVEREVDVLVMSTGFQPQRYLASLEVVGRDGRSIHELWGDDPRAFLGITVAGFPNFFILYGPNTNGGYSEIAQLERQAEVVVRTAKRMRRRGIAVVDTRQSMMDRWVRWVDRRNAFAQSAGFAGCHNYYFAPSGRNVTQFPDTALKYFVMTKVLPRFATIARR